MWFAWQAARTRHGGTAGGWQCPYPVPHLIECGAMLYMLLAVAGSEPAGAGTGMAMPGTSASPGTAANFPAIALVLAFFMIGYVVWITDRLTSIATAKTVTPATGTAGDHARVPVTSGALAAAGPQGIADAPGTSGAAGARREHPAGRPMLAPGLATCYKIAMGITMGYMLIRML